MPWVAISYYSSEDARTFTFNLRHDVVFSDGTPLKSADVVNSFNRLIQLKGRPSFLLTGVSASGRDSFTVVLTSIDPNPTLPLTVANPALAIVNSAIVKKQEGSQTFLNGTSAGSGPYILQWFSTFSDIGLAANPHYWGPKPFYRRVVIITGAPSRSTAESSSATWALPHSSPISGRSVRSRTRSCSIFHRSRQEAWPAIDRR